MVEMRLREPMLAMERRAHTALRAFADRRSPLPPHQLAGLRGEDAAFFHLRSLGYTIAARRWRTERLPGDLDIVAWDGPTLVLFEVKTRTAHDLSPAEAQVTAPKQRTLRRMASAYLRQIPEPHRDTVALRFDVLSVYLLPSGNEFEHLRDAFPPVPPARSAWR